MPDKKEEKPWTKDNKLKKNLMMIKLKMKKPLLSTITSILLMLCWKVFWLLKILNSLGISKFTKKIILISLINSTKKLFLTWIMTPWTKTPLKKIFYLLTKMRSKTFAKKTPMSEIL
jgi:hypothetical protein